MKDPIDRQAALEIVRFECGEWTGLAKTIENRFNELPSAREKGAWIDCSEDGYVECPFCGSATNCDDNINDLHYCFSCGAHLYGGSGK